MHKRLMLGLIAPCVFGLLAARPAYATLQQEIQVKVPFPFTVMETRLPAGTYVISQLDDNEPSVLQIRSLHGTRAVDFLVENVEGPRSASTPDVVFDRYGRKSFLHQVWDPYTDTGVQLVRSHAELRAASRLARAKPAAARTTRTS